MPYKDPQKAKERSKRYYEANAERERARSAAYRASHPEQVKLANKEWRDSQSPLKRKETYKIKYEKFRKRILGSGKKHRENNREKEKSRHAKYTKENPKKNVVKVQRSRARKLSLPIIWSEELWQKCLEYFSNACAYCGGQPDHQDHFIPLIHPDCPGTVPENMIPACRSCNLSKGSKFPIDWCLSSPERRNRLFPILMFIGSL